MTRVHLKNHAPRNSGFTLLEALLLVTVLGIGGAATGRALTAMAHSPEQNNNALAVEASLLDKMEYLHSVAFSTLASDVGKGTSSFTDLPTIEGTPMNRVVSIVYIVPATGSTSVAATHMVQVTVTIDGKSVISLVNEP